jgi:hypothetical protein
MYVHLCSLKHPISNKEVMGGNTQNEKMKKLRKGKKKKKKCFSKRLSVSFVC